MMDNCPIQIPNSLDWKTNQDYPLIPFRYYGLLIRLLQSNGYDVDYLLKKALITRNTLNKPETRITWRQVRTIITGAYKQTRHPALGLHFGQKLTSNELGPLGMVIYNSKNFREGLNNLKKYFELVSPHSRLELDTVGDEAVLRMHLQFADKVPKRFIFEAWAASWSASTKLYIGVTTPQKYVFSYPAPSYADVYNDVLEAPVEFGGDAFEIRFLVDVLDYPLSRKIDTQVAKLVLKQCDKVLKVNRQYEVLISEIYRILAGQPHKFPSLESLAKRMGVAPRTLSRNLQLFGTSYRDVVESVRMGLAIKYLKFTELPIEEIAEILHYADASSFRRAFKKRTGKAPSVYRTRFLSKGMGNIDTYTPN